MSMKSVTRLKKRLTNLDERLRNGTIISRIIKENEAYIIDLNAEQQIFEQGVNRLGVKIADYMPYSPLTIQIKREKGQPTDRVTLRDTGEFETSFFLEIGTDRFEIKARDEKTEDLIKKYGRQIFGLTKENIQSIIQEYIYPDVMEETRKIIYGN